MSKRQLVFATACAASCVALLSACYFTTSFEGLSSGGAPATDGGGAAETATDSASSVETGADAGRDAATDACAVPGMTTRLCDDFDRSTPRGAWTGESTAGGGTIEIVTDPTTSSRAFHARAPRLQASLAQAYLRHETRLGQKVRFEMDLRYTQTIVDSARQIAIVDVSGAGKIYVAMFVLTNAGMAFYEQVDPGLPTVKTKIHLLKVPVTAGAWHRLSLDLDFGPNRATILVDGKPALPAEEVYDYLAEFVGSELTVTLGPSYSSTPSEEIDTFFDNVVVASD